MTYQILSRRSTLLNDRPFPTRLGAGELSLNLNPFDPGLYFADNTAAPSTGLIKIGPVHVSSTAPNAAPTGFTSLSSGEQWLNTSSSPILNIHDGTSWQQPKAVASVSPGSFPSSPINGQLHYDESVTTLYIYRTSTASWTAI
jgi:hypothetical protein